MMTDGDGYATLGFVAEFYDQVYAGRADIPFYLEEAGRAGGPVLEIACGTGRVLLPLARAGVEIAGLDSSPHMLEVCRRKLAKEPKPVRERVSLVQADMRDFDLGRRFALITVPFRAFQHLIPVADQLAALRAFGRHLEPGGRLVLDLFNPSLSALLDDVRLEEWGDEPEFVTPDGRGVLRRFRITRRDYAEQVQDVEMIYYLTHLDGRRERLVHAFPMRYLFRFEVEHLLARAGFTVEALYADFDRAAFGSVYPGELLFLARM